MIGIEDLSIPYGDAAVRDEQDGIWITMVG
jgi:hypothetical protein